MVSLSGVVPSTFFRFTPYPLLHTSPSLYVMLATNPGCREGEAREHHYDSMYFKKWHDIVCEWIGFTVYTANLTMFFCSQENGNFVHIPVGKLLTY